MRTDTLSFRDFMWIDWSLLPVAIAGGAMGAALGAGPAFIFTGVFVLIGVAIAAAGGGKEFIGNVAFGPLLGPHVSFAGGVAAAAFAAKRGYHPTGRDIGRGLMGLNRLDVLAVGGLFGGLGLVVQSAIAATGAGPMTDSIALTVFLLAILTRLAFGKTGLWGDRSQPGEWLPFQRDWTQVAGIGAVLGFTSAYLTQTIGVAKGGDVTGFGFAAVTLLFLHTGTTVPVWHHIALPAAVAFSLTGNLWIGCGAGVAGAVVGELFARAMLNHGDTHIDPPAAAIATLTTVLKLLF
ncbi:MAG TPA: hypothetical protein VFQ91_02230 [Bryobacteraceae bacterium]|nr:hypothetical protein [Bryobacteraceae bacterium]